MAATRRLAAILAADVAGYSRLIGSDEQGTLQRLKAIRAELIDPAIAEHNGRIVKTTGDGLLAEFGSTVDALRCAGKMQVQLAERNFALAPDTRIEWRVGIHQGDIVVEADGDIFGDSVNIAARLEALAEPGGICVSARVQEDAAGRLDLAFRELGEQHLKNIARPVRAYAAGGGALGPKPTVTAKSAPRLSIVVLPFANLSGDPEQGYFADGITEDLTTDLSRVQNLLVIARNTAFTYKDKPVDVKQIGPELGVRYVLEGSVRRLGDQVRVNAQLVDAETGAHLWAERFDHEFGDLFALENEITARIANTLGWELISFEVARPPAQPDALDYILRGRAELAKGTRSENIANAMSNFERALALDPRSAEAAGQLAFALVLRAQYMDPAAAAPDFQRADDLIAQALALSPREPSAHLAKGQLLWRMRRWEEAMPEFEAVLAVDRNHPGAVVQLGMCKYHTGGSDRESIALAEQAIRLSPHDPGNGTRYGWIGTVHLMQSRIDEAIPWLEKGRSQRPEDPSADWFLAAAYGLRGDEQLARARLAEATRVTASDKYSTIARIRANGELNTPALRDRFESVFLAGLRKAGLPEE